MKYGELYICPTARISLWTCYLNIWMDIGGRNPEMDWTRYEAPLLII